MNLGDAIRKGADNIDARDAFDPADRAAYLNASEAMTCIRKQWYAKNGIATDGPENWGYARRGKHGEVYMVDRLRAANVPLLFAGEDEQVQIQDDELQISCTPDGLAEGEYFDEVECWLGLEFKTIDPRTNRQNLPKEENVRQLQIAMEMFDHARDEFPELGEREIKHGILIYMDASNYDDTIEFKVPRKPKVLEQLKGRANRVLKATSASRLAREGKERGGHECRQRCNFTGVCGVDGAATTTGQGRKGAGSMPQQREKYMNAKRMEEQAKAEKTEAGEQIKALLKQAGTSKADVEGGGSVSLSPRAGSVAYAKVVKEHLPDLDLEPYRGAPSETLTVK